MQVNLQRRKATNELFIEASKSKAAIALIQEPYVGSERRLRNFSGVRVYQNTNYNDGTVKAAMAILEEDLDVTPYPELTTNNKNLVG